MDKSFNLQPFGVQFNLSVGVPEESKKTPVQEFEILSGVTILADSKTFRNWTYQPWNIQSTNGVSLATFNNLVVTFVKGIDQDTGIEVVFATILFRQTSNGYRTQTNGGLSLRIMALNQQEGVLEDWQATNRHEVFCSHNGYFITYKQRFRPDWFNLVQKVAVVLDPSTWHSC